MKQDSNRSPGYFQRRLTMQNLPRIPEQWRLLLAQNARFLKGALALLVFLGLFFILFQFSPGGDFSTHFQPAARALLQGGNPYDDPSFFNPPWALLILIPPALLPPEMGSALFALIGAAGYIWAFSRLKAKPIVVLFLVLTPGFLAALFNPNFDWAVALGYTLPPQLGLFFVLSKPHIAAPLVIFWLVEAWRTGGFRQVLWVFGPVTLAYGLSFLIFGPWLLQIGGAVNILSNLANVWPWGLLAGFVLFVMALRERKMNLALIAGPFISPYLATYSWLPAILGLLPRKSETIAACIAFWIAWLITSLPMK